MLNNTLRKIKYARDRFLIRRSARKIVSEDKPDEQILALVKAYGSRTLLAQAEFGQPPDNIPLADHPLSIIVLTQPPGPHRFTLVEATLSSVLVARGHDVRVVLCDKNQPGCDLIRKEHVPRRQQICSGCHSFGQEFFKNLKLKVCWSSSILEEFGAKESNDDFRDAVESSLMRHWKTGRLPENVEDTVEWEQFSLSAKQSQQIGVWAAEQKPDLVLMSHGIYVAWEPAFKVLLDSGIPVLTHDRGRRGKTEHFHWNSPSSEWDLSGEWSRVKDTPLSPDQRDQLESYVESRKEHKGEAVKYSFGDIDSFEVTLEKLNLDPQRRRFVLYPNLMWDANSIKRATIFESPTHWIRHTIDWFKANPASDLIIRVHPAEAVRGVSESVAGLITEHCPALPSNIRMIAADEEISSFNVQQITDVGLVYTSTVGMELALQGKPVGVAGRVHYGGCGFTQDFSQLRDYDNWLTEPTQNSSDSEFQKTLANRYFYLWACRAQIPLEVFHEIGASIPVAWKHWNLSSLWEDVGVQLVINSIETQSPVFMPTKTMKNASV